MIDKDIVAHKSAFGLFSEIIQDFARFQGAVIKTSEQLSKMMAAKARLLADSIKSALDEDERDSYASTIGEHLLGFREVLIPKITHREFSDIYAQTIAYGMFAARLRDAHDSRDAMPCVSEIHCVSVEAFTRFKAAQLIPQSNPFLRKLFQYIAGHDLDSRISWMVDALADLFNCAYVPSIQEEFRKKGHDPILHFYETFLSEYDPSMRKSRGVWYTPPPVVQFIVQAVDDILKTDFNLSDGLADTSKIPLPKQAHPASGESKHVHRVQILDPAAGTGTFLAEVVRNIYRRFENQRGMWQSYVGEHLIPRLTGFEILMASYAMAHLKLDMLLQETGYVSESDNRLRIYLTNSLSAAIDKTETSFVQWLTSEANEAGSIKKRDAPVMVVLGNPPYSGISQNSGKWITDLIENYKYVEGIHFNERKHWLQDDYVKFIRYGQYFIEENGEGILAFINNHNFLDNPTFRGMRWSLLKTFDKIYILDLHGAAKKKENAPDGGKDENVFDIQQGVSINIFVKTRNNNDMGTQASRLHVINKTRAEDALPQGKQAESLHYLSDAGETPALPCQAIPCLATVYHADLYGKRADKYDYLLNNDLQTVKWQRIESKAPFFFFVPKSEADKEEYKKGFAINECFNLNVTGIVTMGDSFIIDEDKESLKGRIIKLTNTDYNEQELNKQFSLGKNYSKWVMGNIPRIKFDKTKFVKIDYRPFDTRWTYFDNNLVWRWRENVMRHFLKGENIALLTCRQSAANSWELVNITKNIVDDSFVSNRTKERGYVFPLYLYPDKMYSSEKRKPNLNQTIINEISRRTELPFAAEPENVNHAKETAGSFARFTPIDIFDYIYAVLHSPAYREKYREFLKIDFPRVPYPQDAAQFGTLVAMGAKLRRLHLMEGVDPQSGMADFPAEGGNEIENLKYVGDKVYINKVQYFDHVPSEAWNFYIGGYQPAQKWLKDRKGRILGYDDIRHYQRIIHVLKETAETMREMDSIWDM